MKRRWESIFEVTKPDIVLSTYPPIETLDIGLYLGEKFAVPLVADFRDGLLFEPVEDEMLRSRSTRSRYRRVEARIARQAAGIITVSDPISDYFRAEYAHQNVLTLPNGFDPDEPWESPDASELDPDKFNMVYTGRLGMSERQRKGPAFFEAVARLVRASPRIADKLRVHFVGEFTPAEQHELGELIGLGVARVHGFVARKRALGFQRAATLLLLIAPPGKTSVATGKLFEYLNAGRPILGLTRGTTAEKIILATRSGFVANPSDADAIHAVLSRLIEDPSFLNSLEPSPDEIAKYSRPLQMQTLATYLRSLA